MIKWSVVICLVSISLFCNAQQEVLYSANQPNFRIHPGNVTQTEVFLIRHPFNENILFSSCNTLNFIPFFVSEGIFVSEDGGNSWFGSDTCKGAPVEFHGGDPGITIDKDGTFILTRLGRPPFSGLYSHYSVDNGRSWSSQQAISTDDLERAALASDVNVSSAYYGRTYAVWVKFAFPFPLMVSYTNNGAKAWSVPVEVNAPSDRSAGGDIAIGSGGKIYTCWAGVTQSSPFKEIQVGFASSTDGGLNWSVQESAFAMNGITGILQNKNSIRVNGLPAIAVDTTGGERHGWIYIVTGEKELFPAGTDPDIVMHRSTDGGLTWSQGIRINQDARDNGKSQYFPSIEIDNTGSLNVVFYDDRFTTNDSAGVMLARSTNGGDTWKEYVISDHNFKPAPIGGLGQGYQGDNIDITSTSEKLWPVWMDNSTGIYQIWASSIDISALGINNISLDLNIQQNFPNPFSEVTTIPYTLKSKGIVSVKILDIAGKIIAELINENQNPGNYEIKVSAKDLGIQPGMYLYQLRKGETVLSGKMFYQPE